MTVVSDLVGTARGQAFALKEAMMDGDQLRAAFLLGDLMLTLGDLKVAVCSGRDTPPPCFFDHVTCGASSVPDGPYVPPDDGDTPAGRGPVQTPTQTVEELNASPDGPQTCVAQNVPDAPEAEPEVPVSAGMRWRDVL